MFIQTESTPNPASIKFLPGCEVLGQGSVEFRNAEEAKPSPLAKNLFNVQGVAAIMLGHDFITVTKNADAEWPLLKPHVLAVIMDHFTAGFPVMEGEGQESAHAAHAQEGADAEIIEQIKELLDARIRPAVAQDGGDILFHGFDRGIVYLSMKGACAGCPSSTATLKSGIENMLKHYIPDVLEVRSVL
ncbi:MAG: NifU family protein [Alphaproteobacteria bacterium]